MVVWAEKDSNLRSRKTADLQSAPVGRLGICPKKVENLKWKIVVFFVPIFNHKFSISNVWSHLPESNQRPTDYKSVALPAELKWLFAYSKNFRFATGWQR